jgi:hypothetical protein
MQIQLAMRHDRNGTLWISRNKMQYSTLDTIKPARYFIPWGGAPRDEKPAGFMVSGRNYYYHSYQGGIKREGALLIFGGPEIFSLIPHLIFQKSKDVSAQRP